MSIMVMCSNNKTIIFATALTSGWNLIQEINLVLASAAKFFYYKMKGLNSQTTEGYTYHLYPLRNLTHK